MDYSDTVVGRIWMCTRTIFQMLQDRKNIEKWENELPSFDSMEMCMRSLDLADTERSQNLLKKLRKTIEFQEIEREQTVSVILEIFWICGKVGKNSAVVKSIVETLEKKREETGANLIVLIILLENCSISNPARAELNKHDYSCLEFFKTDFLIRNITHHKMQPKFKILSADEATKKMKIYCATPEQFPSLLWNDPIRRYFGLKEGQIIRSKRFSDNGREINYRCVRKNEKHKKGKYK